MKSRARRDGLRAATSKKIEENKLASRRGWSARCRYNLLARNQTHVQTSRTGRARRSASADGDGVAVVLGVQRRQRGAAAGLNGVATFVRNKAFTSCGRRDLRVRKEFDDEGRCVLTDHGTFVLFNAYVPNGSGGKRLA